LIGGTLPEGVSVTNTTIEELAPKQGQGGRPTPRSACRVNCFFCWGCCLACMVTRQCVCASKSRTRRKLSPRNAGTRIIRVTAIGYSSPNETADSPTSLIHKWTSTEGTVQSESERVVYCKFTGNPPLLVICASILADW